MAALIEGLEPRRVMSGNSVVAGGTTSGSGGQISGSGGAGDSSTTTNTTGGGSNDPNLYNTSTSNPNASDSSLNGSTYTTPVLTTVPSLTYYTFAAGGVSNPVGGASNPYSGGSPYSGSGAPTSGSGGDPASGSGGDPGSGSGSGSGSSWDYQGVAFSVGAAHDTTTTGSAPGRIYYQLVSGPSNGTLVLNLDGRWTFTPNYHEVQNSTFTFNAWNGASTPPANLTVQTGQAFIEHNPPSMDGFSGFFSNFNKIGDVVGHVHATDDLGHPIHNYSIVSPPPGSTGDDVPAGAFQIQMNGDIGDIVLMMDPKQLDSGSLTIKATDDIGGDAGETVEKGTIGKEGTWNFSNPQFEDMHMANGSALTFEGWGVNNTDANYSYEVKLEVSGGTGGLTFVGLYAVTMNARGLWKATNATNALPPGNYTATLLVTPGNITPVDVPCKRSFIVDP